MPLPFLDEVILDAGKGSTVILFQERRAVRVGPLNIERPVIGVPIQVCGCSYLQWRNKVHLHRDYFDAGALLYEHLPLLGRTIGWLKRRLA